MSRVGKQPIPIPPEVKVAVDSGVVRIEGPKGKLQTKIPPRISVRLDDGLLITEREDNGKVARSMHGLIRSLLNNSVVGVTKGFSKALDVVGIGFRAEVRGRYLNLSLGFSHPVEFPVPEGIEIRVERIPRAVQNYVCTIVVGGYDKYRVGQVAADIRALRPPDAYKGKGIRYSDEAIRLKVGKKGA